MARAAPFAMTGVVAAVCLLTNSAQAAVLIQPDLFSFSSQRTSPPRQAIHTVDGSGLTNGPSGILGAADSTHNVDPNAMWLTYGNLIVPIDVHPSIAFDLKGYYDLVTTRIWNYNQVNFTAGGAMDVQVAVSLDGTTFTPISTNTFARAFQDPAEVAQDFATAASTVRYVRFTIFTDYFGNDFLNGVFTTSGDQRRLVGLSEVRFEGNPSSSGPPFITQQPVGMTSVSGQSAVLTVGATNITRNPSAVAYQWRKNGTNLVDGAKYSGVTTGNLSVNNLLLLDAGNYDVVVRNTENNQTITSVPAFLRVVLRPTVSLTLVNTNILLAPSITYASPIHPFGDFAASHLTDGSGLTAGPSGILGAADSTHGNLADAAMYQSSGVATAKEAIIIFNLGAILSLHTTRIWNYNELFNNSPNTGLGAADIEVAVSLNNTNYTVLTNLAPIRSTAIANESSQDFGISATGVRYVRFDLTSFNGGKQAGLSEVRFISPNAGTEIKLDNLEVGLRYAVEYRNSLNPADPWQVLRDIPKLYNPAPFVVTDPTPIQTQRYYRAVLYP